MAFKRFHNVADSFRGGHASASGRPNASRPSGMAGRSSAGLAPLMLAAFALAFSGLALASNVTEDMQKVPSHFHKNAKGADNGAPGGGDSQSQRISDMEAGKDLGNGGQPPKEPAVDHRNDSQFDWKTLGYDAPFGKDLYKIARTEYPGFFGKGWFVRSVLVADLDGDGRKDIAFLNGRDDPERKYFIEGREINLNDYSLAAFLYKDGKLSNVGALVIRVPRHIIQSAINRSPDTRIYWPPKISKKGSELVVERAYETTTRYYVNRWRWVLDNGLYRLAKDEQEYVEDGMLKGVARDHEKSNVATYERKVSLKAVKMGEVNTGRIKRSLPKPIGGMRPITMEKLD